MAQLDLEGWTLREIKSQPITEQELDTMYQLAGSYEALFSKKSTQIRARGINVKSLKEEDFRGLILEHYSFLKRPVFIYHEDIFIGNSKATTELLHQKFGNGKVSSVFGSH